MTECGTVGKIYTFENTHYWTFEKFPTLSATEGDFFWSPEIRCLGSVWKMRIYPGGTTSVPDMIMLQVWRTNASGAKPVRFSIGITKDDDSEEDLIRNERLDTDASLCSSLLIVISRSFVLRPSLQFSHYGEYGELEITFRIWIDEPTSVEGRDLHPAESPTQELAEQENLEHYDAKGRDLHPAESPTQELAEQENLEHYDAKGDDSTLRQHLENMLLSGDDHDVTIKVKDKQFSAHKSMLRTRSPLFSAMFKHKMKESAEDSISIDDCDPESFGEFLQYVYTGRVKNLSLSNATGLYYAGHKFELLELKKMCVEFLKASLSTAVISDVISLAVKHGDKELLEHAMPFFSKNVVEIMTSAEWKHFALGNPFQANEISSKAVKCRLGENSV